MAKGNERWLEQSEWVLPLQRVGEYMVANADQFNQWQHEWLCACSDFAFKQMRNALDIRDVESLQRYWQKQEADMRQFSERVMALNRDHLPGLSETASKPETLPQSGAERRGDGQAKKAATQPELGALEAKLDDFSPEDIQALYEYEQAHQNRESVKAALQRHMPR
ncbi:hypothetical protein CAI21_18625 [Alkalilimnicola ehrlichii]|uniref:Uncharacterized protein n=1 Tax=Alkalilimnicola ehrlichii TaxID=351052 RepID=A0A3E0WK58_9GAMM|nr:hypothetical protein [Alkalilimnicola ehrlichii]RFA25779.1 hypothetical protein CAI21_18625 [Alkalilimnicola ehrlichii]RFA32859.1 hypothetical protein CAL65_18875 [Alkalilimnicola ehrlichii]